MIIKGGPRCDWRFYATHLTRTDTNERMSIEEIRGLAAEDVRGCLRELDAIASGTRTRNGLYVASLNPCEDEQLTREQWGFAVDRLERELGLTGQPRIVVEHFKEGRTHRHAVWGRVDADTMKAIPADHNYAKHQDAARDIERELGLAPVESVLLKDRVGERPERRPKDWESFRAADTGIDPHAMKAELTALWQAADSGLAFKAALEEAGYILAKGDRRDFCVIDAAGDEHSLARRISGAKAADIRERMGDIDRDSLPTVAEARRMAQEARAGGGGTSGRTEQQEALTSPAAPATNDLRAAVEAEEARQIGPAPEWTPDIARELAGRFGDRDGLVEEELGNRDGLVEEELGNRDGLVEEELGRRDGLVEETLGNRGGLTAEPFGTAEAGEPRRASSWGYAWRAFSDRARAFGGLLHEVWHDETSGTPEAERGFAARLLDTGRELIGGLRGRNAATFAQGVEDAAGLARDRAADGAAEPKSWVERVRERAAQIWRNERGAAPDFETGDALWEVMREDGPEAPEWESGAADPDDPPPDPAEPDEGGLDGPGLD